MSKLATLINILTEAELDINAQECAEALWLGLRMGAGSAAQSKVETNQKLPVEIGNNQSQGTESGTSSISTDNDNQPDRLQENFPQVAKRSVTKDSAALYTHQRNPHAPTAATTTSVSEGHAFRTPAVPALIDALHLGRALKPLKQVVPSRTRQILDEAATVKQTAEYRTLMPVFRGTPERWLEIALVIDSSSSMLLWEPTLLEFRHLLENHGAFSDVRLWRLAFADNTVYLHKGDNLDVCRPPKELMHTEGRRLIIVASDFVATEWRQGLILSWLKQWSHKQPVALLHMLPQRLWRRSALRMARRLYLRSVVPKSINSQLVTDRECPKDALKLPVLTLEPDELESWSQLLKGQGKGWVNGVKWDKLAVSQTFSARPNVEITALERLKRFEASFSPQAQELVRFLAIVPLTLPVMRLIQHTFLPTTRLAHLAEVLLSGLLYRVSKDENLKPMQVMLDFHDGIRPLLLDQLSVTKLEKAYCRITQMIESHLGQIRDFLAVIATDEGGNLTFDADKRFIARIHLNVLRRMGGRYSELAGKVEKKIQRIETEENYETYAEHDDEDNALSNVDLTERAVQLSKRGNELIDCYIRTKVLENLEQAITAYKQAVILTPEGLAERARRLNDLGAGLRDHYVRTRELADLEYAILVYKQSVELTPKASPDRASTLNKLGNAMRDRYAHIGEPADLEQAIAAYQQAIALTPAGSSNHAMYLSGLGSGLTDRYVHTQALANLEQGIAAHEQAVQSTPKGSPNYALYRNNIGIWLAERYYVDTTIQANLEQAITTFAQGAQTALEQTDIHALNCACNWFNLLFQHNRWQDCPKAFATAQAISTQLLKIQSPRNEKAFWLQKMQKITSRAAYAFVQLGQADKAVLALEQSTVTLLSETLELNHAHIERLKQSTHPQLYTSYQEALGQYWFAQARKPENMPAAWQALEKIIEQIQHVEGFANFLQPATLSDIQQAATQPLVYLVVTEKGGVAVVVTPKQAFSALALPELTEERLREKLQGYFEAYHNHLLDHKTWQQTLEDISLWLWQTVMALLCEYFSNHTEITLIPSGLLVLLPLHAAIAHGKHNALDYFQIRYAPNATTLNRAKVIAQYTKSPRLLAVENPANNMLDAVYATEALNRLDYQPVVYKHSQASHDNILNALTDYDVIHCYCHGSIHTDDPLQSTLQLADKNLTLQTVLNSCQLNARLVILCACETGMLADLNHADKFVNFSTGLLQAGAVGVIASLWAGRDDSTMILINRFYFLWKRRNLHPAEALRQAQIWLRDSDAAQRLDFFQALLSPESVAELRTVLTQDFSPPYFWAGFVYLGG